MKRSETELLKRCITLNLCSRLVVWPQVNYNKTPKLYEHCPSTYDYEGLTGQRKDLCPQGSEFMRLYYCYRLLLWLIFKGNPANCSLAVRGVNGFRSSPQPIREGSQGINVPAFHPSSRQFYFLGGTRSQGRSDLDNAHLTLAFLLSLNHFPSPLFPRITSQITCTQVEVLVSGSALGKI